MYVAAFEKTPTLCDQRDPHVSRVVSDGWKERKPCAFDYTVSTCCDMLGVVGSNLTIFELQPVLMLDFTFPSWVPCARHSSFEHAHKWPS